LAELIELAGPSIDGIVPDAARWSQRVARIRDDLTHWDPEESVTKLNGAQLLWLAGAVGTLVTVCLLRELEFTNDERVRLLADNRGHQHLQVQLRQHLGDLLGLAEPQ
jgi:hypothetical protein